GKDGLGIFPDAVSARGKKHLDDLVVMVEKGLRAVLIFCVQRDDISRMRAAREIDPVYADALDRAMEHGVEVYAYVARLSPQELALYTPIPVLKS
ncbi:MAG: DNA/RNA nuclease SfsA, partial [Gammaproteobacteria bacterium]|nr:DNA/RNA nuclease SfsA [Gammaproteobacteria bacterium]